MEDKIEIETSVGNWVLVRPKAGTRNRALEKAESPGGGVRTLIFLRELLPRCINRRPENFDQDVPIEQVLDDLEIFDYDKLLGGMSKLLNQKPEEIDEKKN
jgi:hypothetical protein